MSAYPVLEALREELAARGVVAEIDGAWLCQDGACIACVTETGPVRHAAGAVRPKLYIAPVRNGITDLFVPDFHPSTNFLTEVDVAREATEIVRRCEERARQAVRDACHRGRHVVDTLGLCRHCGKVANAESWAEFNGAAL